MTQSSGLPRRTVVRAAPPSVSVVFTYEAAPRVIWNAGTEGDELRLREWLPRVMGAGQELLDELGAVPSGMAGPA